MSGGSYNYLYFRDICPALGYAAAMAARLRELGHADAADRMDEAVAGMRRAEEIQKEMQDVWKAVEWCDSGDWGEDSVAKHVAAWAEKRAKEST